MHKTLKEFFTQNNLAIERDSAHGVINGYEINCVAQAMQPTVGVFVACYVTQEQRAAILGALGQIADKKMRYEFNKYGLWIGLDDMTAGKVADRTIKTINEVLGILSGNGALGAGYCPVCGGYTTAENSSLRNIDGLYITLDNDCVNMINESITQENLEFENAPNNYLKGFVGALIGAVAGAVVAIILNIIGFYAGISSFVSFFVGILLYRKFGGKPNKTMIVIVTVTTFVMMIIAVLSIYLVIADNAAAEAGSNLNAIQAFGVLMKNEEFAGLFYADLAMTLLFTVIGCVSEIVKTSRNIKRSKNI